jgi:hypothetical protein
MPGMDLGIVQGALFVLALVLAIGGGFLAAWFLAHAARQWANGARPHDR